MKTTTAILLAGALGGIIGGAAVWVALDSRGPRALAAATPSPARAEPISRIESAPEKPGAPVVAAPPLASKTSPAPAPLPAGTDQPAPAPGDLPFGDTALPASAQSPSAEPATSGPFSTGNQALDEALSFALEAADRYVKEGFTVREDYWGGDLPVKQSKAIVHQLFKGNENWFWMGTPVDGAKISVHVYDSDGKLAEAEFWQKKHKAAARVVPKKTGAYYLIVEVEESPQERTPWAMTYGFR